ncbi:MAG: response regulator, partial [Sphingomonadales bacterium]
MINAPIPADDSATLLVVDDDRDIRMLLANSLGARGYRVETASNTRDMDQILARTPVDLIILDVMMPGEDGLSACRRIARVDGPEIVLLSALGEEQDRILGLEVGASHYLPKPCSPREILATVRAALRKRGATVAAES